MGSSTQQSEVIAGFGQLPPADYIAQTKLLYDSLGYDSYRWAQRVEPPAWVPPAKELADSRILLIGSGGVYRRGQVAFHTKDDTSLRVIESTTPTSELRISHFAYDQVDARQDPNCVFPLDRLRDLAETGAIGGICDRSYGFMGGIYSSRRLEAETVPLVISQCRIAQPDVVLLIPV